WLELVELHALREIVDVFALWKASRFDTPAQLVDLGLRNVRGEATDRRLIGSRALHGRCLRDDGAFGIGGGHGLPIVRGGDGEKGEYKRDRRVSGWTSRPEERRQGHDSSFSRRGGCIRTAVLRSLVSPGSSFASGD